MSDTLTFEGDYEEIPDPRRQEQTSRRPQSEDTQNTQGSTAGHNGSGESGEFTLTDYLRQGARPNMGGLSDAAINVLMEVFNAKSEYDQPSVPAELKRKRFKATPLDANTTGNVPALIINLPVAIQGVRKILAYVLLFEQSGSIQFKPQEERRGESYDRLILTEDYFSEKYRKLVVTHIQGTENKGDVAIVNSQVIMADTMAHLHKDDSKEIINRIFDNAFDQIVSYYESLVTSITGVRDTQKRFSAAIMGRKSRMEVNFDYSGATITDSSGIPIRSDIVSSTYYAPNEGDEGDAPDRIHLGDIRAGVDLFLSSDRGEVQSRGWDRVRRTDRDRREDSEPFLDAVLNIYAFTAGKGVPFTLELAQTQLAHFVNVTNKWRWTIPLKPRTHIAGDLKPIVEPAALNLLNPDPDKAGLIEDLTPQADDLLVENLLADMIYNIPAVGLLYNSSGELSAVLSIYEEIANATGERKRDLIASLYASANVAFNGKFYDALDAVKIGDESPVSATGGRGFIGYWLDRETGVKRPLPEWNVPAIITNNKKNPEVAEDFQLTYDDENRSTDRNLSDRYSILQRRVPGLRPVSTAPQLILNWKYLRALALAAKSSGCDPVLSSSDTQGQRRHSGNQLYRSQAGADLGESRRGGPRRRDDDDYERNDRNRGNRSPYRGDRDTY